MNNDLRDTVQHTPFVKRSILDESAQLLEPVLMALEKADNTSHKPSSSVLGAFDNILDKN
jgi:hypothetical protein